MRALPLGLLAAAAALVACYQPATPAPAPQTAASGRADCPAPETGPRQPWQRGRSRAALAGEPHHAAADPVINPGEDAVVNAKFAYGIASADLEGEEVGLWLRRGPCGPWDEIARARTDRDGRASVRVPAAHLAGPGAYPFQLIVRGDLSRADGVIYALPPGTQVVVFDVDGTLTTGDRQLARQLALGDDPTPYAGAAALTRAYARAGYVVVYISGRPYLLRQATRAWLRRHGFSRGPLITTETLGDARPGPRHVGRFKVAALRRLLDGPRVAIVAAYGNATTDICAYAEVGIPVEATFIIGRHAGKACAPHAPTRPVADYVEHLRDLGALAPAGSPPPSPPVRR